jgi:hypothetical protein
MHTAEVDQYEVMARPGANLELDQYKPREGFALSGVIPMGKWNQLVFRRVEAIEETRRRVASVTPETIEKPR